MGILSAGLTPQGDAVIVGCGDGTIATLKLPKLSIIKSTKVSGSVTSITFDGEKQFFAGTAYSNIYTVDMDTFTPKLKSTCHYAQINDISFPP